MADSPKRRLECVWCTPNHPLDGRGPITQEERQAGVSSGMCPEGARRARETLEDLPPLQPAEDLERAQLQRYIGAPDDPEMDEAGVHRSAQGPEWRLYWTVGLVSGLAAGLAAALVTTGMKALLR